VDYFRDLTEVEPFESGESVRFQSLADFGDAAPVKLPTRPLLQRPGDFNLVEFAPTSFANVRGAAIPERPTSYARTRGAALPEDAPPAPPRQFRPVEAFGRRTVARRRVRPVLGRSRERRRGSCRTSGSRRTAAPTRAGPSDEGDPEPVGTRPRACWQTAGAS